MESISIDDRELPLYVTAPGSNSYPGILLVHAWWGFNECFRDICDRLASEGFLVVAPDLYHGDVASTTDEADAVSSALDATRAVEDVSAAFDFLRTHQRLANGLGVIAASMGVYYALRMVQDRPDDIDATVVFYGTSDGDYVETSTAVLGHFGENDPFEPEPNVEAFRERVQAGDGPVTFHTYPDTEHWFFESDRPEYDEDAAELAWSRTVEFLRAEL
ncbi:dienelactone hydrolase family protein [Natrinema gelatinilyticum]|uniref:dienelactone hydrolase family protein n=1 Tax=Natrinema gelatinilyticum TaxID=2961571 RepID=UPI0020C28DFD|nr:dienelactone hydrolase family protein [Natrinema gelatinilyticum]